MRFSSSACILYACHPLWLGRSKYIQQGLQVMELLIMQFSLLPPFSSYSLKYFSRIPPLPTRYSPSIINQVSYPCNTTYRILIEDISVLECVVKEVVSGVSEEPWLFKTSWIHPPTAASYRRRLDSAATPLWEPQNSLHIRLFVKTYSSR